MVAPVAEGRAKAVGRVRRAGAAPIDLSALGDRLRADDWVLESGDAIAVVSARDGNLNSMGPRGGRSGLSVVAPTLFDPLSELTFAVDHSEQQGAVLYVRKQALERPVALDVWFYFADDGVLHIESRAVAQHEPLVAVTLGEVYDWGNVPTWIAGHGFKTTGGTFAGSFLARDSLGLAYAACSMSGNLLARIGGYGLPGFHRSPRTGETVVRLAPGEESARRDIAMSYSTASLGDAATRLPCTNTATEWTNPKDHGATWLEVASCADEQPLSRFSAKRPRVPIPAGCFRGRFSGPGLAPGPWLDGAKLPNAQARPRFGTLSWKISDESGNLLPAKLLVRGKAGSPSPDWGDDPIEGAARNFVYSTGAERQVLPPGQYEVLITHGFEHSASTHDVTIEDGGITTIEATLRHVVNTDGWISADLHVHALPSFDSPTLLEDRVRSLAAVGVEVGVATDHNAITDYGPTIAKMALHEHLASVVGDEVTAEETYTGHFNVFPLQMGLEPLMWENMSPSQLFGQARHHSPHGVIQVNHPRMGSIGYFDLMHLDTSDVAGWKNRATVADMAFDAIEVFNGDEYARIDNVREVMDDWYALLNAGLRYTATGNSDSHKVAYHEAGVPRNWVQVANDDPAQFDEADFIAAIRAGRVVVSSGPFIEFTIAGKGPGSTVPAGAQVASITVTAPDWVDVDHVEVIRRGKPVLSYDVSGEPTTPRFTKSAPLLLKPGDWLIVIASGRRYMRNLYRNGAQPFAFTNAIWVE